MSEASSPYSSRLEAVLDIVEDRVVTLDVNGRLRGFSPGAMRMFGYAADEMSGVQLRSLVPELGDLRELLGEGRTLEVRRKDGQSITVHLSLAEVESEAWTGYVGVIQDVTALEQAEAELARTRRELELAGRFDRVGSRVMLALGERSKDATPYEAVLQILAQEADYRPLTLYGWDARRAELSLRASLSLAPGVSAARFELGQGLVGEAAQRRQPVFVDGGAGPFELDTGFGMVRAATLFAVPLLHGDVLLGVIAGSKHEPVTERERAWLTQIANQIAVGVYAAEQYRELLALSDELDERARTIEHNNQELARANRMKSEFLATMSHELRTPLNAIIGFTNILLKNKAGTIQAKELSFLGRVLANSKHLLALINDILNLSKFEAGRLELELEDVDLRELITELLADIDLRSEGPGPGVVANVPEQLSPVRADRRRLKQVLINLLANAIKFTEAGSVELEVVAEGEQPVRIDVLDGGIGIPRDRLEEVMEAFRQVDSGAARRYGGTGLGLTIAKIFCLAMGFALELDSVEGQGTVVSVLLSEAATRPSWRPPSATGNVSRPDPPEPG